MSEPDGDEADDKITQDELILGDYPSDEETPDYHLPQRERNRTQSDFMESSYFDDQSLSDYLKEQLNMLDLDDRQQIIATYIIGNLDENGYLLRDLQAIADDLLFQQQMEVFPMQLEDMLYEIQDLDPAGVGARDLRESLLLQIKRKEQTPTVKLAQTILNDNFEEFSRKHYENLPKTGHISR